MYVMTVHATEDKTATITIEQAKGTYYEFYRLMDLKTDGEHYAYSINDKYRDIFTNYFGSSCTDEQIIEMLEYENEDSIRSFADFVYEEIERMQEFDETDAYIPDKDIYNPHYEYDEDLICTDLPQGYYLIVQNLPSYDTDRSLVMLETLGKTDITITEKSGNIPTLNKTTFYKGDVSKHTSEIYYDDNNNGSVGFKIICTIPDNIENYNHYKFIVHDNLPEGLTFEDISYLYIGDKYINLNESHWWGFDINYSYCSSEISDCTLEFIFEDLKDTISYNNIELNANTEVIIGYSAKLNKNFVVGNPGNQNIATLEFSNDPYDEDITAFTPNDYAKVFAFNLQINKIDKDKQPLAGAEFKLQRKIEYGFDKYEFIDMNECEKNADGTIFTFNRIGTGKYKLIETKAPVGYNKADDFEFEIEAFFDDYRDNIYKLIIYDKDGNIIKEMDDYDNAINGIISIDVVNTTGIKLPNTGSTEAILIYFISGITMAFCITLFIIAKKKERR